MRNQRVVERISQMLCTLPFFAKFYLLAELHVRNVRTCVIFLSFFSDFLTHALQYMVECMSTNLRVRKRFASPRVRTSEYIDHVMI